MVQDVSPSFTGNDTAQSCSTACSRCCSFPPAFLRAWGLHGMGDMCADSNSARARCRAPCASTRVLLVAAGL